MKRVLFFLINFLIVLSTLILISGCECSREDPLRQAIDSSFKYLKQGDFDKYMSYFDVSKRNQNKMKEEVKKEVERRKGIESYRISDIEIDNHNKNADAEIKIQYKDGSAETIVTHWKKKTDNSDRWFMQAENSFFGGRW